MKTSSRGTKVLMVIFIMFTASLLPFSGSSSTGEDRGGLGPLVDFDIWTDSFDDLSHVYVPPAGLAGVEVVGGQAKLEAGSDSGWIASSVISVAAEMRYDYVSIDADTPGNSYINVSILNASADATEIGFANDTIGGFKLRTGPALSLLSIEPVVHPDIRIQVNLVAVGDDRPALNAWSLYFLGLEVWRDDFMGSGKMSEHQGLNFTGSILEVNLTASKTGGGGPEDYEAYPTVAMAARANINLFLPNTGRTGYLDKVDLTTTTCSGVAFEELNGDGYIDLVATSRGSTSKILWGSASGTYSMTGAKDLSTTDTYKVDSGDFNGDGWYDLAFSCYGTGGSKCLVFINKGSGTFGSSADLTIDSTYYYVKTGDVNGDGFDDVMASSSNTDVFYGSASGVDGTSDATLGGQLYHVGDLDGDGIDDVLTRGSTTSVAVYLGKSPDIDATADYTLVPGVQGVYAASAGDVNGDGYVDIVLITYSGGYKTYIHEGASDGWTNGRTHSFNSAYGSLKVGDVDKDGYDDIVQTAFRSPNYLLEVYKGGTTWPSSVDISKSATGYDDIDLAIPSGAGSTRAYRGTFTTETIRLPSDKRWDVLYLNGDAPKNTSITFSVLDDTGKPLPGYEDLDSKDVDLAGVNHERHTSLRVRVELTSEFNNTTPILDALLIKWMDARTWRDEFFGVAKIDRLSNLWSEDGRLGLEEMEGQGPQLIFACLAGDDSNPVKARAFRDAGGGDYLAEPPIDLGAAGTSAVDVCDVGGDGHLDLAFARYRADDGNYSTQSPLYMGGPLGLDDKPAHRFPTTGASDLLLRDLNGDGYTDAVFAQERKGDADFDVRSTLFWGSAKGWYAKPDVEFSTTAATGVEAVDVDGDGRLDLVFACYRGVSASTDSLVFVQNSTGFNGSAPDSRLATNGARAVAAGDVNGDGHLDLAFANSFSAGFAETDSYLYLGRPGGTFSSTPMKFPTKGAMDVEMADLDGDGDMDLVFANHWSDGQDRSVDSAVYLNGGSGAFGTSPDDLLPTTGATGVCVADVDGTGWKDLVFSCQQNATTHNISSVAYLGGASGWSQIPDILLPTVGASDVAVATILDPAKAGYLSNPIPLDVPPRSTGTVHTLRYIAQVGPSLSAQLRMVDDATHEVLAETDLVSGENYWDVRGLFDVRSHPTVRVMIVVSGRVVTSTFSMDGVWLNWTKRVPVPPLVLDMGFSAPSVYRTENVDLWINVSDDYDPPGDLVVMVEHRVNGSDTWEDYLVVPLTFNRTSDSWTGTMLPKKTARVGLHDFRVSVTDVDQLTSDWVVFEDLLEVLNNIPFAPVVEIIPEGPVTTSDLSVMFVNFSRDVETMDLIYSYLWYQDGELVSQLVEDNVPAHMTVKDQNWSVEVHVFDGIDEGPIGFAYCIIENAPPKKIKALPDPKLEEGTVDEDSIDLSTAFEDPDGDPLTWSVAEMPEYMEVVIDQATGKVRLMPDADWFGEVNVIFIASDGELEDSQNVTVRVTSVNDVPWIDTVDGKALTGNSLNFTIALGEVLVITYTVRDVEGDEVQASVSIPSVILDEGARTMTFDPGQDLKGTFTFTFRIWDVVSPGEKVSLDITIEVVNENDPMDDPTITNPEPGSKFLVGQSFTLSAFCNDPDVQYGQELEFVWSSNISGELGRGTSIVVELGKPGVHLVTLTVRDPDFEKSATIEIVIQTPEDVAPPTQNGDDAPGTTTNWSLVAVVAVVLAVLGALMFFVGTKRRTERFEAEMDTTIETEGKQKAWQRTAEAIKAVADELEADEWVEDIEDDGSEERFEDEDYEEIPQQGTAGHLSMEAQVTEEASEDVKRLWSTVGEAKGGESEQEKEALRLDNLKRKHQNAIGRLPYGIPSKELADRDWVDLAHVLATGEKKQVEGGKEVTRIDGRWYFSDPDDTGTFLKEHGVRKKDQPPKTPTSDKERLLAKLEERFIMGEISEEVYKELKEKYSG